MINRPTFKDEAVRKVAAADLAVAIEQWFGDPLSASDIDDIAGYLLVEVDGYQLAKLLDGEWGIDPDARLVETPIRDIAPKRVLGTSAPELRGKTMPRQPGVMAQPAGPVYVSDVA